MKKLITLLLVLTGMVCTASAGTYKIYVKTNSPSSYFLYVWGTNLTSGGTDWPGVKIDELSTETVNGTTYYTREIVGDNYRYILDEGEGISKPQTTNSEERTSDTYVEYNGGTTHSAGFEVASVSFVNEDSWTYVYAYPFKNNAKVDEDWPGKQIYENAGVYTYTKYSYDYSNPDDFADHIIFNGNSDSQQTPDLVYTNGNQYKKASHTVSYVNRSDWSTVKAYIYKDNNSGKYWGDWSGVPMIKTGFQIDGKDVYSYTGADWYSEADIQPLYIIFNNGNSGDDNQTIDLTFTNGKTYNIGKKSSDTEETTTGTINATLSSTGMSTFSSPFALDFSNAITGLDGAYVVSSLSASSATLTSVEEAPANTGLILKGAANASISIPYKASAAAPAANKLSATSAAPVTVADNEAYILYDGEFHPTNAGEIPMFKAYLKASDVPTLARSLSLVFDDESTGINEVKSAASVAEGYYNLAGQRIAQPTKGLYIVNGKKVIIK